MQSVNCLVLKCYVGIADALSQSDSYTKFIFFLFVTSVRIDYAQTDQLPEEANPVETMM